MAQPTPYTRQFSFTDFQEASPSTPLPGDKVDAELNAVKVTSDQTRQNLSLIQRDDGELQNAIVTSDKLNVYPVRAWAPDTQYQTGNFIIYTSTLYSCAAAHQSSSNLEADIANGMWAYITNLITGPQGIQGPQGTPGLGDVIGPGTNTDGYIPQWDGTDTKTLKNGLDPATILRATDLGVTVQSYDGDLNAIAALSTQTYGRSLLTLSDAPSALSTLGVANANTADIIFVIDGGNATITTGLKGFIPVDFPCTINQVTLLAEQSGSIVIDIWKDTYANYPPTGADTITASAKPTISSATKSQDSTLTGWTKTISAGDVLGFNVDSITSCQRVTLALKVTKS